MNKQEIFHLVKTTTRKKWVDVTNILNCFLRSINKALVEKKSVHIPNFGKFYVKKSKLDHVYDFKRKKLVPFKGKYVIKFKPSEAIEKRLNKGN